MPERIDEFAGRNHFLSNFFPAVLSWEGQEYPTSEHAFNAGKTLDPVERARIAKIESPGEAKRAGRQVQLRPGWNERVRYEVMASVLEAKFTAHPARVDQLLATGDAVLVEGNRWDDQHWGDCRCGRQACAAPGENHLGRLLMELRTYLRARRAWEESVVPARDPTRSAQGVLFGPTVEILDGGDIFAAGAEAIVNPVNCRGVMGAGLAAAFKARFPAVNATYQVACEKGEVRLGQVHVVRRQRRDGLPAFVINFPTKDHWRDRSEAVAIEKGLADMVVQVREHGISSIAIPALGCGLGGLRWADVRPMIEAAFANEHGVRVLLYPPRDDTPRRR